MRVLLLVVLTLLAVLPGIGSIPPVDRDEARYVQATKQMLESRDFVDIRFQDESRYKKPIGIYWMQSAVAVVTGDGPAAGLWQYRLVSSLGILIAVFSTWWAGVRLFGTTGGLAAGVSLAALFGVAFEGHIAKTDAMLLGLATLAQAALVQIHAAVRNGQAVAPSLPWVFWAAQAVAILVKGPIAPLLSALTIAALFAVEREGRWLRALRPLAGLGLVLVVALPWLVAITVKSEGAFWQEAVGRDMLGKVAQGEESHGAPPGYYVLTFGLYTWPFGFVALWAGLAAWGRARAEPRLLALICWYAPFWLLFELIPTKLPHYVLPAYPSLALLLGWMVARDGRFELTPLRIWQKVLAVLAGSGHVIVSLGLAVAVVIVPFYLGTGFGWQSVPAAALALIAGALAWPLQDTLPLRRLVQSAFAAVLFHAALFGSVLPSLERMWLTPRIVEAFESFAPCTDSMLASSAFHEPSLVFLAGTGTVLTDVEGVARHLSSRPDCAVGLVKADEVDVVRARLGEAGLLMRESDPVSGLNYSKGDDLTLVLVRAER